jgi:diacylglycerol O-acyltransferase
MAADEGATMERLSGLDAGFLSMETSTSRMHVANLTIVDPSTAPHGFGFEALRDLYASRLHLTPAFRQRLVEVPFGLHHPVWVDDPSFDLGWHLRHIAVPSPGGVMDLCELAGHLVAIPLDRSRPLWETWLIEGVEGGRVAVLTKVHHAALHGPAHRQLLVALLDVSADGPAPEAGGAAAADGSTATTAPAAPLPSDAAVLAHALGSLAAHPLRAAGTAKRTVEAALRLRGANRSAPDLVPPPSPFTAPRTSFNTSITPHRTFAATSLPLGTVQGIKRAADVTVNDVVLTVCAGALRRYLDARGERPDGPLVAMVPVSIRAPGDGAAGADAGDGTEGVEGAGSAVASVLTTLATDVDDPLERLRLVHTGMDLATRRCETIGAGTLRSWVEFAAPALVGQAARLYSRMRVADRHRPLFNVTIANVPGPEFPLYLAGAHVLATYPMSPVFDGAGLNISVLSYQGTLDFGILACPEVVSAPWILADALHAALDELAAAVPAVAPEQLSEAG